MLKGFYTLTSGMLTKSKVLQAVGDNMAGAATPGYKKERVTSSNFKNTLLASTGNRGKSQRVMLGNSSMISTAADAVFDFQQGALEKTERKLDFAINGAGMFRLQTPGGDIYTRNGSFNIDQDGYLNLANTGQVMGTNGPIRLASSDITVDDSGRITDNTGKLAGQIELTDFADSTELVKVGVGLFSSNGGGTVMRPTPGTISWKNIENSNVELADEMTSMLSNQRTLQSCSQLLKMYDQMMNRAVNEIGKL